MSFSPDALAQRLAALPKPGEYVVAFSGGLDSCVLLHAICRVGGDLGVPLSAVHVDHGLSPHSGSWADHCRRFCEERHIALDTVELDLDCAGGESIEACAREARYQALEARMQPGAAVLTAHHQDDLAETFLLQALRGSGPDGLAAIAPQRTFGGGMLLRPLLSFTRNDLEEYARAAGIQWIEDSSNEQVRFDRNFLRREVMPILKRRWPAAAATLSRSAANCAEVSMQVAEWAGADLATVQRGEVLDVELLAGFSAARQRAVLRRWFQKAGLPVPGRSRITELQRQLAETAPDRQPLLVWSGVELRRWRGRAFLMPSLPSWQPDQRVPWNGEDRLQLPGELGYLECPSRTTGVAFEVRFREGGETLRRGGRRRTLKGLLQALGIPPWLRDRIPLLFAGDELVAVGDYLLGDGWPHDGPPVWSRGRGWPVREGWLQPSEKA